jgi:5-formyltetrahydrofolate cyclo-ligase
VSAAPSPKAAVRDRVWQRLTDAGAAVGEAHGRIPNFVGSREAAARLAQLEQWRAARTVMVNPDEAQQPVRALALSEGKLVFMAVPRLAQANPFYRLDPQALGEHPERAAERHAAAELAPTVAVDAMPPIDVAVCGSVAVNPEGVRLGKGAGYSDIELGLLAEAGLLRPETLIVTTVHELQVLDEPLPHDGHDFPMDLLLTPARALRCASRQRPGGLDPALASSEMAAAIPVLRAFIPEDAATPAPRTM